MNIGYCCRTGKPQLLLLQFKVKVIVAVLLNLGCCSCKCSSTFCYRFTFSRSACLCTVEARTLYQCTLHSSVDCFRCIAEPLLSALGLWSLTHYRGSDKLSPGPVILVPPSRVSEHEAGEITSEYLIRLGKIVVNRVGSCYARVRRNLVQVCIV